MNRVPALSALFFGLLMAVFGLLAAMTLLQKHNNNKVTGKLWDGSRSLQWEEDYTQNWPLREPLIGLWGGLRYHLFRQGSEGVVIGRDGWLFSAEEFAVPDNNSAHLIAKRKQELQRITQELRARDIQPLILWIPEKARLHADKLGGVAHPNAHRHLTPPEGIALLNAEAALSRLGEVASMRTDSHWSPEGAKAVAEAVARKVQQRFPELDLHTTGFQSHAVETEPYTGDLARFVPTGPLPGIPAEPLSRYRSDRLGDSPSLFGEQAFDIILIGTSYSAQAAWHFSGFLKQALESDVLNLADEAEGPFPPMRRLLHSLDSGEIPPPKLVIWEFPGRYLIHSPQKTEGAQ